MPTAGTVITAGLHAANYGALQTLLNGGLDTGNWASGKIFAPSKLMQDSAVDGDGLAWDNASSTWKRTTDKNMRVGALVPGSNGQVLTTTGGVAAWGAASTPGYATTLPGSPTDGQEAILVDSITLPTYQWRFRWNNGSSNANKWEFIGGAPALVEVVTSESINSATYVAAATAGPSFTVPLAGVYEVEIGFSTVGTNANSGIAMSYDIGGTGAVDADACWNLTNTLNNMSSSRVRTKTGLTAATALVSKYREVTAAAQNVSNRWMRVVPVRVS